MENLRGPRLFEREWIYILTTSDQHRIRSKLRFRKNMPFFGSVRYLFLRRKSATKDSMQNGPIRDNPFKIHNFQYTFPPFFNQGLRFDVARLILKRKAQIKKSHSRSKSLGPLRFSILCFHARLTKAFRRRQA
jgi:hypothetical protein